jgi:hypothetical protein
MHITDERVKVREVTFNIKRRKTYNRGQSYKYINYTGDKTGVEGQGEEG